jgi:hypothetical protein
VIARCGWRDLAGARTDLVQLAAHVLSREGNRVHLAVARLDRERPAADLALVEGGTRRAADVLVKGAESGHPAVGPLEEHLAQRPHLRATTFLRNGCHLAPPPCGGHGIVHAWLRFSCALTCPRHTRYGPPPQPTSTSTSHLTIREVRGGEGPDTALVGDSHPQWVVECGVPRRLPQAEADGVTTVELHRHGAPAHNMPSATLRRQSEPSSQRASQLVLLVGLSAGSERRSGRTASDQGACTHCVPEVLCQPGCSPQSKQCRWQLSDSGNECRCWHQVLFGAFAAP